MERIASATEDEMVLSFLRAERTSPRWGEQVADKLAGRSELLDEPDLGSETENQARQDILGSYRGYRRNAYLFEGFPNDLEWCRVRLTRLEVCELLVGRGQWDDLTEATRKVGIAAKNARTIVSSEDTRVNAILAIVEGDHQGRSFEPLIIAALSPDGPHVLIEGYSRACAYASTPQGPDVDALSGYSPNLRNWLFWGLD